MSDFMVLKRTAESGEASDWEPIAIVRGVEGEEDATKAAYVGEGFYKVLPWDDDVEVAASLGEPEVTMVRKKAGEEVGK